MKVFFTYQGIDKKHFYEFDVSSSLTVAELIRYDEINQIISNLDHELVIAVTANYLMEILNLFQINTDLKKEKGLSYLGLFTKTQKKEDLKKFNLLQLIFQLSSSLPNPLY